MKASLTQNFFALIHCLKGHSRLMAILQRERERERERERQREREGKTGVHKGTKLDELTAETETGIEIVGVRKRHTHICIEDEVKIIILVDSKADEAMLSVTCAHRKV